MIDAGDRIPPYLVTLMRNEILACEGREVFFVCAQDESGSLVSARPVARGNDHMVPAPLPHVNPGDIVVHNHPSSVLMPSDADLRIAAELGQEGVGSWIIDNDVTRAYVITEAYSTQTRQLDQGMLAEMLLPGGDLSKIDEHFETREPQLDMLEMVIDGFNDDAIVVAEAGTGVGKSLAYLIPAFGWVIENSERVVISTATINLQQQILAKDIPTVKRLFAPWEGAGAKGKDVRVVIAKGRNQYLCQNRLQEVLDEEGLFGDEQLDGIRAWSEVTETGDRSDLSFSPDESLWSRINSDPDACSEMRCKLRGSCFLQKARKEAAAAHIIITNHHLLFADLAIRNQGFGPDATVILPAFQRLIIDEAHNIEQAATSYFSEELNRFTVFKYSNMLLRQRKSRSMGIVAGLRQRTGIEFAGLEGFLQEMKSCTTRMDEELLPLFEAGSSIRLVPQANAMPADLRAASDSHPVESLLFPVLTELQQAVLNVVEVLSDEYARLDEQESDDPGLNELRIVIRRLESVAKICADFRDYHVRPDLVYWLDRRRTSAGDRFVHLTATPLEVGGLLQEALFSQYPSIILTSATLSVNRQIQHWTRRVGLEGIDRVRFKSLESPFDYGNRVLLGVPTDAPDPAQEGYVDWLKQFIISSIEISGGHALVLFTSYSMLRDVYDYCKPILVDMGIPCLRQGDDDRGRLLSSFVSETNSVLFATHSFWEGVDAPGDALQLLIICRLPFRVPTDPVLVARTEALQSRGGNPFFELSLPEAVMKLKQGFGRLMRRKSDRGIVFITDKRIITKQYGRMFINSLPPARQMVDESSRLHAEMERVLFSRLD